MEQTLEIESLAYGGAGIAHDSQGKTVFVADSAPGDTVRVAVEEEKKTYSRARTVEVLSPGPQRITPICPLASECGGCQWQHIAYEAQLSAKRGSVVDALVRIAHWDAAHAEEIVRDCRGSKRQMGYRNKLELACTTDNAGHLALGFHEENSNAVCAVGMCPLAQRGIEKAPKALQGALRYLQGANDLNLLRVGVRHSLRTHSCEIALWTKPGSFPRAAAAKTLASACKTTSIVRVLADPGKRRAIRGVEVLSGAGFWEEQLHDAVFKVSAPSFFQVNTAQAEQLVDIAIEGLHLSEGDAVADLYCGVGTFTMALAQTALQVYAVESAGSSVRDLRRNAEENGVYIDVIGGDSARELPGMGHLDALVVDPPRNGLADGVAQSIAAAEPVSVAYVSCNPTTWARDVERLEECGYTLQSVVPVDLFPQTYHCELVSIFSRDV